MTDKKSDIIKHKAIFFDRDGVVNYRPVSDYVKKVEEFYFIPDFFDFFKKIKSRGYLAVIISNQQGVGKGIMTDESLTKIHDFMQLKIHEATGYRFDDIFVCTELESSNSSRRKPNPGMLLEAIKKWDIDTGKSWMIGDSPNDIIAGQRAGVRTIFLGDSIPCAEVVPDIICKTLDKVNI